MEAWIVGLIMGAIELVITTVLGLLIKTWWTKKQKEKQELEELREQQRIQGEARRCDLVKETIHTEVVELEERLNKQSNDRYEKLNEQSNARFEKTQEEIALLKDGLQKDLYVDLCNIYDQYRSRIKAGGHISRGEKTEYDKIYWSYHNLGKNGVADKMHNEVMDMPEGE